MHGLAARAEQVTPKRPMGPASNPALASVAAGEQITTDLVRNTLLPAAKERLGETGDVMVNVATEYKNSDDSRAAAIAATYGAATGEWTA
ncbi:hypothetical protein ACTWPB_01425 [Nocardia sp. IBHARD005]|uniref:hypothetical protein n=1 Tax=Nocardia sp. IBHARD005 TaxID=3457765 RepID=UPI0040585A2F